MKKFKLKNLASLFVAVVVLSSCGGLNKMKDTASSVAYDVTPDPLEVHGGQVEITVSTQFPGKYFNKKAIVVATPVIAYNGGKVAYDSTVYQGEAVEANNTKIPFETGKSISFTGSVPYNEAMMTSELKVEAYGLIKDTKVDFLPVTIAEGVIATSTLVEVDPKVIMMGDNFERIIPETFKADIHYVINKSDVRNSELRTDGIKELEKKIVTAKSDERKAFKGAGITGYASPDGPVELNTKLSEKRSQTAENYLKKVLKKAKVEEATAAEFLALTSTPEDWEGFKELMEKSTIQDKDLILRVLSMYSDPVVREKEIKNIAEAFEVIKDEILPQLRRSKLKVNIDNIGYSDEELVALIDSDPDTLNIEEMLYAASLVDDMNKKLSVYQKAAETFPNDVRAINNVGYAQYELGNVAEAKAAFEAAKEIKDGDIVNNNIGACTLMEGEKDAAEELLTSAMGAGEVVNYNLGIIKIIDGDYEAAVNYFGNMSELNAGLAKLLNGATNDALSTLNSVENPSALVDYLKAVIGARQDNADMVLSNLRAAVTKDDIYKAYAKKDLEFRKFRDDETFQSLVAE